MFFRKRQPPDPKKVVITYFIIGLITLGFATHLWQHDARLLDLAKASVTWPVAQGTIEDSHIEESTESSKSGTYQVYKCVVAYRYNVGGKPYSADRISFATRADYSTQDRAVAEHELHEFSAGNEVKVRYNPANPSQAVLVPGVNPESIPIGSLMYFALSAYVLTVSAVVWLARGILQPGPSSTALMTVINLLCLVVLFGIIFNKPAIVQVMVPPSAVTSHE